MGKVKVSNKILETRIKKGISRNAIWLDTDMAVKTIREIEIGNNHRLGNAIVLCNALGTTLDKMYGEHLTALQ